MNYWIFQSKKDRYDISDSEILFDGMEGYWVANQYRSEMNVGDKVFFWLAGDKSYRGIYGWGILTSVPYPWESNGKKGFSVDIKCIERLKKYISVHEIKENAALKNIQILNMPIGSNFLLNSSEGKELEMIALKNLQEA